MEKLNNMFAAKGRCKFSSVVDGAEALALLEVYKNNPKGVLYIALDDTRMARAERELAFFAPDVEVLTYPAWDSIPYDRVSPNSSVTSKRIKTLSKLVLENKKRIVITTVNAIIQKVVSQEVLIESSFSAGVGDEIKRDELVSFLIKNGYINSGTASESGEFALRGSIVDIFPTGQEHGFRLDFFDTRLETIRTFDPITQISGGKVENIDIVPASEVILDDESIKLFRHNYREMFGTVTGDDPLYEAVSEGRRYAGMEYWIPLFYEKMENLLDYLPDVSLVFDHLAEEAWVERERLIKDSFETRKNNIGVLISGAPSYHPIPPESLYITEEKWNSLISKHSRAYIHPFNIPANDSVIDFSYRKMRNFSADSVSLKKSTFDLLKDEIKEVSATVITCMSEGSMSRIKLMLDEHEIFFSEIKNWSEIKSLKNKIGIAVLGIENGFKSENVSVISEQDIFGEKIFRKKSTGKKAENFLTEASTLAEGELVVHRENGIGRFEGLQILNVSGEAHDCLKIVYDGGDRLFVPVENIDLLTRYGAEDENAKLDRLGAVSWQQRTSAIKKRIKVTADELLQIAAERELKKAPMFYAGSAYSEFCARFPYAETEDQESSINDTLEDLASGKPMDRLICGDVGFGKTEVALRAAFVVTNPENSKKGQVALITPTTLLCRQHFKTFSERFSGTDVKIKQLSRLVSSGEAKKTHEMIENGEVDIVIGTHALLSRNTKFKDLSLLIIDEEQHFGVAQKERLKKLRSNTHVLTMTATPIPRTLQLSLSGIRDLSLIATPPIDRLAVRTYVMPFDQVIIREAILREHYRGGRTFYVCPRISDLEKIEGDIKKLVPEIKMVSAHGRMPPEKLDNIMNEFYEGKYDVLLSTTIIESGLDIPTANTLIIHKADMYGLAQLYQLRGRVGRSKMRAYAYLTLPPRKKPTKQAVKRLEVMQKLDGLGAGFSLASHDMDIRGFGNLLGDEQSGNIREIGIELYQDMLREAIEVLKSAGGAEERQDENSFSPQINMGTSVLIPESYVSDLSLRLGLYRRIADLEVEADVESIAVELVDRFGPMPVEVKNLLSVVKIKQICRKIGVDRLDVGEKGAAIGFYNDYFSNPDALIEFINKNKETLKIRGDQRIILQGQKWHEVDERIKGINTYLDTISKMAA